jgi:hypothetical protein
MKTLFDKKSLISWKKVMRKSNVHTWSPFPSYSLILRFRGTIDEILHK